MAADRIFTKQKAAFMEERVGQELVLMQIDSGQFHALKGVGLAIWQALDETGDPAEIVDRLVAAYAVPAETCAAEVNAFLAQLQAHGLVAPG